MRNDTDSGRDDQIAAWRSMLIAHSRALRAIEADMAASGTIPLTTYDVLLELNANGEPLRMQDLSDRVVLSRTRVSRLVGELETEELVTRSPDPDDGRSTLVSISETGRAALSHAAPIYMAGIDRHFTRHLTTSQQRSIASGLNRVVKAHSNIELQR